MADLNTAEVTPSIEAEPDELMLVSEVARLANRSSHLVKVWAKSKGLPHFTTAQGVRIFKRSDVVAFLAAREQPQSKEKAE